ncbi:unnamed protein product [Nesidiocoris tenuis]|uniref:Uncharacterized protein n=1 Tax=Nesidiocoris tenuis TaxID=355587 RepID=A0A6H5GPZ9_9HEMI|nr:unnamed protein product [Nesidiocoris tenuis]
MSSRFIRNEIGHEVVSCRFVDANTKFTQTPSRVLWNFRILLPCPTLCLFFKRCNAIPSVLYRNDHQLSGVHHSRQPTLELDSRVDAAWTRYLLADCNNRLFSNTIYYNI